MALRRTNASRNTEPLSIEVPMKMQHCRNSVAVRRRPRARDRVAAGPLLLLGRRGRGSETRNREICMRAAGEQAKPSRTTSPRVSAPRRGAATRQGLRLRSDGQSRLQAWAAQETMAIAQTPTAAVRQV